MRHRQRPLLAAAAAVLAASAGACGADGAPDGGRDAADAAGDASDASEADVPGDDAPDGDADSLDGSADAAGVDPARVAACSAYCDQLAGCQPSPPPADEVAACRQSCVEAAAGRSAACDDAATAMFVCSATLDCATLLAGPPAADDALCRAEYGAYSDACLLAGLPSCVRIGGVGDPCDTSNHCVEAAVCDAATSRCVAAAGRGAPCSEGIRCGDGLACGFESGLCAPLPGEGEPCALGALGPFVCAAPLGCLEGSGRRERFCGPLPGDGEACTVDSRCGGDLGCDFSPEGSICRARRGDGGRCETDRTCADGHFCDLSAGVCRAFLGTDAPCTDGNECGPGATCTPRTATAFVCAPAPGPGEPCFLGCAAGLYCGQ
jgi:hypothetical protein